MNRKKSKKDRALKRQKKMALFKSDNLKKPLKIDLLLDGKIFKTIS